MRIQRVALINLRIVHLFIAAILSLKKDFLFWKSIEIHVLEECSLSIDKSQPLSALYFVIRRHRLGLPAVYLGHSMVG
jgi:hypothetical protein